MDDQQCSECGGRSLCISHRGRTLCSQCDLARFEREQVRTVLMFVAFQLCVAAGYLGFLHWLIF